MVEDLDFMMPDTSKDQFSLSIISPQPNSTVLVPFEIQLSILYNLRPLTPEIQKKLVQSIVIEASMCSPSSLPAGQNTRAEVIHTFPGPFEEPYIFKVHEVLAKDCNQIQIKSLSEQRFVTNKQSIPLLVLLQ